MSIDAETIATKGTLTEIFEKHHLEPKNGDKENEIKIQIDEYEITLAITDIVDTDIQ